MRVKSLILSSAAVTAFARAFETGKPGWKMDGDKLALDASGNPIYVKSDGTEQSVQGDTISRLNDEAKNHRTRAETAEKALEPFKGLDPEAARKAVDTVSKIDAKKLIDAGEVDKVRDSISQTFTAQIAERDKALAERDGKINQLTLDRAFSRSQFIADKIAVPREMFEATFSRHFKVEDGKVVPYGADGNKIFSRKRMGEDADVDEALEILIEAYPHKDQILKAPPAGGTGNGGHGGGRGGARTMARSEFDSLDGAQKAQAAAAMSKGEMQIVD